MDTRHLEAFVAVVDIGSFTRAAARLELSQPTVTTRVKALEQGLGTTLIERLSNGVRPTAAGTDLLPYAREMIALSARAGAAVTANGQPHGKIDVGTIETLTAYRLLPVIEFLFLRYPMVQISMHSPTVGEVTDDVRDCRLDCAFVVDSLVERPDLRTKVLCPEPLALVAGPDHVLLDRSQVSIDEIRGITLIRADNNADYHHRFETSLGVIEPERRPRLFELDSIDAVKQSVANGMGLALIPAVAVARELAEGQLCQVSWDPPFETFTQIVWRRDGVHPGVDALLSAAVRVFAEETSQQNEQCASPDRSGLGEGSAIDLAVVVRR